MKKYLFLILIVLVDCSLKSTSVEIPRDQLGIDISHHQSLDLWNNFQNDTLIITQKCGFAVPYNIHKREKISFIYIKASQGANFKDPLCIAHYKQAKKHKIKKIGFYHFYSINYTAEQQFQNFKSQLDKVKTNLPPVVDFEAVTFGLVNSKNKQKVWNEFTKFYSLMIKEYKQCIVYVNKADYDLYFKNTNYPLWFQNPTFKSSQIKIIQITYIKSKQFSLDFNMIPKF